MPKKQKITLVIESCLAHPEIENLKAIKLFFLLPNTTSQTQPMDQCVICSLKAIYCKHVVRKIIQCVERNKSVPEVSLLQKMQMLVSAQDAVTTKAVVK